MPNSIWDLFASWPMLYKNSFFSCIWCLIPTVVTWSILWEQKKCIFRKKIASSKSVHAIIEKLIIEVVNSWVQDHKNVGYMFSSWDNSILKK